MALPLNPKGQLIGFQSKSQSQSQIKSGPERTPSIDTVSTAHTCSI